MYRNIPLVDPSPKWLKPFPSIEEDGHQSYKNRKTYKWLLLFNRWMDFEIIIQECFLGDPLQKLLELFRSVERNGRQGYK